MHDAVTEDSALNLVLLGTEGLAIALNRDIRVGSTSSSSAFPAMLDILSGE